MAFLAKFLAIALVCVHGALSQMWGRPTWGAWNQNQVQQQNGSPTYLTCIGQTANNDQLRVTFSPSSQNPYNREMRVKANIQAGSTSQIAGNFQLVITEEGRIDGMCDPNSLGEIMRLPSAARQTQFGNLGRLFNRMQPNRQQQNGPVATIGSVFNLRSGQSVSMTDILENMSFGRLAGSGMAICNQIVGNRCVGNALPLCCTIAKDGKTAAPSLSRGLVGGMGGGNFGMGGGMGGGLGGGLAAGPQLGGVGQNAINNNLPAAGPGAQGGLVFP